ncbi:putative exostosin [Helianthus debilis subsp. tardiflorus]
MADVARSHGGDGGTNLPIEIQIRSKRVAMSLLPGHENCIESFKSSHWKEGMGWLTRWHHWTSYASERKKNILFMLLFLKPFETWHAIAYIYNRTINIFRHAGISAKKEAPVNFLTDPLEGGSTLRPTDILVFGWIGGKHVRVDLTGVSPLLGLGVVFTVGSGCFKGCFGESDQT